MEKEEKKRKLKKLNAQQGKPILEPKRFMFMAIEKLEVTSNSCDSTPYTFNELHDAFEELAIEFENMNLKYKK